MDQDRLELAVIDKCLARFEQGQDLTGLELDEADEKRIRGFQFFTRKPALVLRQRAGSAGKRHRGRLRLGVAPRRRGWMRRSTPS